MRISDSPCHPRLALLSLKTTILSIVFLGQIFAVSDATSSDIGSRIPDLRFKDIRALNRSLSEMGKPKAWVLVFTTTQCPLVRQTLPKLAEIQKKYLDKDVRFVAVNVGIEDTIREMAAQALELDISFAFVKDTTFFKTFINT